MAKGQYLSNYQQGIVKRYYDNQDTLVVTKLAELSSELYLCDDAKKAATLWKSVQTALKKTSVDQMKAARIVNEKRVEDLAKLVQELSAPGAKVLADSKRPVPAAAPVPMSAAPASPSAPAMPARPGTSAPSGSSPSVEAAGTVPAGAARPVATPAAGTAPPSPEQLKSALKAFKKRLKLTRLDEESKLSNRALTGGRKSAVTAIQPPNDYPRACWEALVKEGHLRYIGSGMYELLNEQAG